jgi:hypothetical protein
MQTLILWFFLLYEKERINTASLSSTCLSIPNKSLLSYVLFAIMQKEPKKSRKNDASALSSKT